ncbi:hypothetical protein KKH3_35490 [Pectobacterium actinidiae]|nr:hypothetical protein KKH3_35490 [Pectobacterium actinidiae]
MANWAHFNDGLPDCLLKLLFFSYFYAFRNKSLPTAVKNPIN